MRRARPGEEWAELLGRSRTAELSVDVVIPTIGRPSLRALVAALDAAAGPPPGRVLVVDDRRDAQAALPLPPLSGALAGRVRVLRSGGRGPAAARNVGWRASRAQWIAFLDDDVVSPPSWLGDLLRDLGSAPPHVAGVQGRIEVPLPAERRPTDWERNVARLEIAAWATADMAYRRAALEEAGGFDERFPRAYREDTDLALRVEAAGHALVHGGRRTLHPVRPAGPLVSVRMQRGNADDALMLALHGRWETESGRRGRRRAHVAVVSAALAAAAAAVLGARGPARLFAAVWLAGTVDFAWRRIAPGPRDAAEVARMVVTSVLIPPAAVFWWLAGTARARRLVPRSARARRLRVASSLSPPTVAVQAERAAP